MLSCFGGRQKMLLFAVSVAILVILSVHECPLYGVASPNGSINLLIFSKFPTSTHVSRWIHPISTSSGQQEDLHETAMNHCRHPFDGTHWILRADGLVWSYANERLDLYPKPRMEWRRATIIDFPKELRNWWGRRYGSFLVNQQAYLLILGPMHKTSAYAVRSYNL